MSNESRKSVGAADERSSPAPSPQAQVPKPRVRLHRRRLPPLRCAPRRLRERRGVLLLVVLSVLVLFVLLTVTYVIVASKERTSARAFSRAEPSGDPPNQVLDSLMMILLRDTNDLHSPFRSWSLLEGIYGNDKFANFRGTLSADATVMPGTGGQFLFIPMTSPPPSHKGQTNYYAGRVLTMLTGRCAGTSTRIVGSDDAKLIVMRLNADAGIDAGSGGAYLDPKANDVFLINGPAYAGMGRGYDPSGASKAPNGFVFKSDQNQLSGPTTDWEYALLPNPAYFQSTTSGSNNYTDPAGPGGANVDYTAYDYNNMYLGLLTNDVSGKLPTVLPSFHRAELYTYWVQRMTGMPADQQRALKRKILFRPTLDDHPIFCAATNPGFNAAPYPGINPTPPSGQTMIPPLDVDNMGTGVPDSIWIDPGLPAMVNKDGKTYKILVAPLILDMDGRVNVNAHGSWLQGDPKITNYPTVEKPAMVSSKSIAAPMGATAPVQLPPGEGYGPAEVNLREPGLLSQTDVQYLLQGNLTVNPNGFQGRHGGSANPSVAMSSIASRPLAAVKLFEYPESDYRGLPFTSFGTPPDLKGRRFLALDNRGQPLYLTQGFGTDANDSMTYGDGNTFWEAEMFPAPGKNGVPDQPYGFNLFAPKPGRYITPNANLDNPFTVAELEKVMRPYDIDNRALAPRLAALLQKSLQSNPSLAGLLTTEQWDVPVPSLAVPHQYRQALVKLYEASVQVRALQFTDIVRAALSSTAVPNKEAEIAMILPSDLISGLRMDINRPFGNGRNDSSDMNTVDGVSDETKNSAATGIVPGLIPGPKGVSNWPTSYPNVGYQFNITNGQNGNNPKVTDPLLKKTNIPAAWKARQLMARYLYTLMMLFSDQNFVVPTTDQGANPRELMTRRVAQWAINAVCFRDSTSAMTPFEYQADIFQPTYKGWNVDGDPGTDESTQGNPGRRIVWGCKPPELLLTETLAFHDFRVADTNWDDDTHTKVDTKDKKKDQDFDQTRIPQGSAFIELYCCRNPNNPVAPGDLYTYDSNGKPMLELGRMSADKIYPVWRLAITQSVVQNKNANMAGQVQTYPDTAAAISSPADTGSGPFPMNLNLPNTVAQPAQVGIERIVWLGSTPPPANGANNPNARTGVFYNRNPKIYNNNQPNQAKAYVAPGGYAVVGPRAVTYVGSRDPHGSPPYGSPSPQSLTLYPSFATATTANDPNVNQPITTVIAAADPPSANDMTNPWTIAAHQRDGIGLNVSEPLPTNPLYYKEPTQTNNNITDPVTGAKIIDAYGDLTQTDRSHYFLDQPLDIVTSDANNTASKRPLALDGLASTGTNFNYRTVFLQRLADPALPWDKLRNPYITVDWMPIDLTRFNGEDPSTNPNDQAAGNAVQFASRQRGGDDPNKPSTTYNIWQPVLNPGALPTTPRGAVGLASFSAKLKHSLGVLNQAFGPAIDSAGDPKKPFPWITWNARPYANVMELLLVPATAPERLLYEFSSPSTPSANQQNQNATPPNAYGSSGMAQDDYRFPFQHLLNFLQNDQAPPPTPPSAPNYYRVLEYLRVPSKFVGTETWLNPDTKFFSASNTNLAPFLPPFNSVSTYREPGKINLNTVTSSAVLYALLNAGPGPSWNDFIDSRRGDDAGTHALVTTNPALPTSFNGVFRSPASADLVPLPRSLNQNVPSMVQPGLGSTLLRALPKTSTVPAQGKVPLFGSVAPANWTPGAQSPYNDSSRNPFFAYQGINRIANNVTTRSNVFAVWLTIGYFEVLPWQPSGTSTAADIAAHADGYQLGAEIGSDTGEIVRHRAFYMIDRSIPVGYERGQNHNVNRAILLRRFIE